MATVVDVSAALRRGRDLVEPELFERLAAFCADEYELERGEADRVMDQALAFVWVIGDTGADDMAPSAAVDPGWHTFMLHTREYADWCADRFGRFVHHAPNSKVRTRGLMISVVERLQGAGFAVDEALWGTAAECNQPACCGDGPCC
ncbi:glycine-rich domain-containing protein [Streptomyces sp. NPDC101118]|uniref:glycine-rich domain-containing protein n=1 Tax=Streptomyces sp. NPDC101118 TaxID=3366109 RepID=UPI00381A0C07